MFRAEFSPTTSVRARPSRSSAFSGAVLIAGILDASAGGAGASGGRISEILASGSALNLSQAIDQLNPTERNALQARWGRSLDELISLSNERVARVFYHGLLQVGRRLEGNDQVDLAGVVYSGLVAGATPHPALRPPSPPRGEGQTFFENNLLLANVSPSPLGGEGARRADEGFALASIANQALRRLNAITGVGDWRERFAFSLQRIPNQATRWDVLLAMTGAGFTFRGFRLLTTASWAGSFESALALNAASTSTAFFAETIAFTSLGKVAGALAGHSQDTSTTGIFSEWAGGAAMLLGLKGMGAITGVGVRSIYGEAGVVGARHAVPLRRFTEIFAPQAGMFMGILIGNRLAEVGGFHPERHGDTWLVDGVTTLIEFNVAGRIQRAAGGPALASLEARMESLTRSLGHGSGWPGETGDGRSKDRPLPGVLKWMSESFRPELVTPEGLRLPPFENRKSTIENSPNAVFSVRHDTESPGGDGSVEPGAAANADPILTNPRVAVIGGGLSGLFAGLSLTERLPDLVEETRGLRPEVTLLSPEWGGKVQDNNEGGQFVDAHKSFPLLPWIHDLGIKTLAREDYDFADCCIYSGAMLSGSHAIETLRLHRHAAREALRDSSWSALDSITAEDFIHMARHRRPLTAEQIEALEIRLGVEEGIHTRSGSIKVSGLSYAFNMAKGDSPMDRLEVVGGPYRMVEGLLDNLRDNGARLLGRALVRQVHVMDRGVRVIYEQEGRHGLTEEMFDGAILAVAPEHYSGIRLSYSNPELALPISFLSQLQATRISKTNAIIEYEGSIPELVTPTFASWESPLPNARPGEKLISFFHGMDGENPLPVGELLRRSFANRPPRVVHAWTRAWDTDVVHGAASGRSDGYTTMPAVGQGLPVARLVYRHNVQRNNPTRLWLANHVMDLGCYMHNAAHSGFLAARGWLGSQGLTLRAVDESQIFGVPLSPEIRAQLESE